MTTAQRVCSDTPKNKGHPKIGLDSTEAFYYLGYNLYLVKTPELGLGKKSCIEDQFPPALLKTPVDGKIFDPNKEHDEAGKYGKVVFAKQVVIPKAATTDFSGFAPLLDRITAVLDHHAALKIAPLRHPQPLPQQAHKLEQTSRSPPEAAHLFHDPT